MSDLHEHLLGVGAGGVDRKADGVDALIGADERQRHHGRPRRHVAVAPGSVLGDLAAELMPKDNRLVGATQPVIARAGNEVSQVIHAVAGVQV